MLVFESYSFKIYPYHFVCHDWSCSITQYKLWVLHSRGYIDCIIHLYSAKFWKHIYLLVLDLVLYLLTVFGSGTVYVYYVYFWCRIYVSSTALYLFSVLNFGTIFLYCALCSGNVVTSCAWLWYCIYSTWFLCCIYLLCLVLVLYLLTVIGSGTVFTVHGSGTICIYCSDTIFINLTWSWLLKS